ncbi:non-hydrolyzing UDP-N-acetylglucosamine 2-epimerase [Desmospora profundinema]|uniref:UDP-N-acetylglucosamine 2-epimerase (Non-hydrolyzing) n=1 Tax=Desmospora profundinema TaxID=1571184 RepID=A0ABU1IHT2_9BACL|nr:UDP-N-acetylglucosamine 2-epimerase (non-hydrolyzing) [Desmospora profundinema]MDR6224333.1 UDP-N-acetylglucosamine 2-epimerase (non-hydrolyzing) [Desmospora profundinema]
MKIMTILGTRPEIIRLSLIIHKLDQYASRHILVHTGQNHDCSLSDIFFKQLGIRSPDYHIHSGTHSFGKQVATMFAKVEEVLLREKPDRILILGDTNSALCAILAERMGFPVYHMEAGNRCYDPAVPEELNRKIIDTASSFNLPYTEWSRQNLLREGIPSHRIWVSGNPIYEVLEHYREAIDNSDLLQTMRLTKGGYILVTVHRAENVDNATHLRKIVKGLHLVADQTEIPVICSIHPRTQTRLKQNNIDVSHRQLVFHAPFSFFDFVKLQKNARVVVTDSGTVQEESCIFGVPAVTIRKSTERPETIACGSNTVSGLEPDRIAACVQLMNRSGPWQCPDGYLDPHVSTKVVNMIFGGLNHV